ncbi:unnamed protein product [Cochlearia groenlandica]
MHFSETSSVVAEYATVSLNNDNDVQSSFSIPRKLIITSEIAKDDDALEDSAVIETAKEEESSEDKENTALRIQGQFLKTSLRRRMRRSLNQGRLRELKKRQRRQLRNLLLRKVKKK